MDEIKTIKLPGAIGPTRQDVFNENGDGTVGYFIYTLDRDGEYASVSLLLCCLVKSVPWLCIVFG